tara:strand:- start:415 stop:810 length:396 start_codon:yes stop_codon:yes gene_type:complete
MFNIIPNKKEIGAEIICDIRRINNKEIKKIKLALQRYGMLFFRNQSLTSELYLKFAKNFGKLANYPRLKGLSKKYPKITVVQRKVSIKAQVLVNNFTQIQFIRKNLQDLRCYYLNLCHKKEKQIQNFAHSI